MTQDDDENSGHYGGLPAQRRQRPRQDNMLRFVSLTDIMDSYERL